MRIATDRTKAEQIDLIIEGAEALSDYRVFMEKILEWKYPGFMQEAINYRKRFKKTLWLAPRGHGKTTGGTTSYATHKILGDPDIRVLLVSNTFSQAEDMGDEIRQNLERPSVTARYGTQMPPSSPQTDPKTKYRWSNGKLSVRDRNRVGKESTLTCMGAFGPVISKHNDVILLDDIVDEETAESPKLRKKLAKWLKKTLLPCLEPDGELHIVGTRWHPLDIYQTVMDELDDFKVIIHKALNEDDDGNLSALWPERMSVKDLLGIKRRRGSIIFNMSYQNDVELAKGKFFREGWFQFIKSEDVPSGGTLVQAYDLALGEKPDSDYFATCTCQTSVLEGEPRFYIFGAFRKRSMTFNEQAEYVRKNAGDADKVVIEDVQYQKALKQEASRMGLPAKGYNPKGKSKTIRGYSLTSFFENKQVFFVDSINTRAMRDEMLEFPDGQHDDYFDVCDMSIKESAQFIGGVRLLDMEELTEKEDTREQYVAKQLDGSDEADEVRDDLIDRGVVYPTCQKRGKVLEDEMAEGKNPCEACPGRKACREGSSPVREVAVKEESDVRGRIMEDEGAWR